MCEKIGYMCKKLRFSCQKYDVAFWIHLQEKKVATHLMEPAQQNGKGSSHR